MSRAAVAVVGWGTLLCVLLIYTDIGRLVVKFSIATAIIGAGIGVYLLLV